jgi:hypothetical protein
MPARQGQALEQLIPQSLNQQSGNFNLLQLAGAENIDLINIAQSNPPKMGGESSIL